VADRVMDTGMTAVRYECTEKRETTEKTMNTRAYLTEKEEIKEHN
jgi:hypothetical protein